MTKEQYQSLHIADLKALAKSRGIKRSSTMRKAELIDAMLDLDEKTEQEVTTEAADADYEEAEEDAAAQEPTSEENTDEMVPAGADLPVRERESAPFEKAAPERSEAENQQSGFSPRERVQQVGVERMVTHELPSAVFPSPDRAERETQPSHYARPERGRYESSTEHRPRTGESVPIAQGILEVMPDGYGFLRSDNFQSGEDDVYVSPSQIRRFNLKTGDLVIGNKREKAQGERYGALLYVSTVNHLPPDDARRRMAFEKMTPIFPNKRIRLERPDGSRATRIVDLISPIGYGQRGMIVSPPKAGKTTLLKDVAKSILVGNPDANLIILLIDERPEEVTDMRESVHGKNVAIVASTFDEKPEHHRQVAEIVLERAKRLVEHHQDVIILLDSITRLTRAYNMLVPQSGRTLSGGLDPAALHDPKRFFGAARNMREGGSLTILATALVDTGSKMDDVVYEEFKGTGNMELILDRKLQEKRIFPAIDIVRSGTRRDDLLLTEKEQRAVSMMRRKINGQKAEEAIESVLNAFARYPSNDKVVQAILQKWQ